MLRRDSNPQFQDASGCRTTPKNSRLQGVCVCGVWCVSGVCVWCVCVLCVVCVCVLCVCVCVECVCGV